MFFQPADNLIGEEDQLAARPGPKVRQSFGNEPLPYGPGREAEQVSQLAEAKRRAEWLADRALAPPGNEPGSASVGAAGSDAGRLPDGLPARMARKPCKHGRFGAWTNRRSQERGRFFFDRGHMVRNKLRINGGICM